MIQNNSKVSIIILTWNGIKHIADCLESVQKSTYPNYEIIVVDNGSQDGSPELIRKRFPQVKLILNKKNLGFTGGNNQAMRQAQGDIFFLLNDDTIIHPDLLKVLVQELESSPEIGIVGPKIYFMGKQGRVILRVPKATEESRANIERDPSVASLLQDDRALKIQNFEGSVIWFAGGKIDWWRGKTFHLGRDLTDQELVGDSRKEVDFITGCALMIKKEVVEKIGLLDETFFAFSEDADWCQKAKKAGYSVIYAPFGGVWHIKSATASRVFLDDLKSQLLGAGRVKRIKIYFRIVWRYLRNTSQLKYRIYRNQFVFFMRHAVFKYKVIFLLRFLFIFTPQFLWSMIYQIPRSLIKIGRRHSQN